MAADSHTEMEEWMASIQAAITDDRQRNRRKKTQSLDAEQGTGDQDRQVKRGKKVHSVDLQSDVRVQSPASPGTGGANMTAEVWNDPYEVTNSGIVYNFDTMLKLLYDDFFISPKAHTG